jgi:hypothetical protein
MKTYPSIDEQSGSVVGFEIDLYYASLSTIGALLKACGEVGDVVRRRAFSSFDGTHIRFSLRGAPYSVVEPFGDNSRYWIGPVSKDPVYDLRALQEIFDGYRPPLCRRLLGNVLHLQWQVPRQKERGSR